MEKNPRDRLFDIGIKLTVVYAMVPEPTNTKIARDCGSIYDELLLWKQELIQGGNADFQIPCRGCHQTPCLCFPHRSMFPNNEFSYMAADCLAFLLLTIRKASSTLPPQFQDINTATHVASKLAISQGTLARQTRRRRSCLTRLRSSAPWGTIYQTNRTTSSKAQRSPPPPRQGGAGHRARVRQRGRCP